MDKKTDKKIEELSWQEAIETLSDEDFDKWLEAQSEKRRIKYPIEVSNIVFEKGEPVTKSLGVDPGQLVRIRPCGEEYGGKTYLGINIGDIALSIGAWYNRESKELTIGRMRSNPAFFVPELKKVIFGAESWWSKICSEDDFRDITDDTIQNQWYVQILKEIGKDEQ